jgi:hypothetical protein
MSSPDDIPAPLHFMIEQTFDPPLTDEEHNRAAALLDPCLQVRGARWMRSYLSMDRRRMVCEFEAADAETVREAYRMAGQRFDRCWGAILYKR